MAMELIDEAKHAGARQEKACQVVGITSRTYQRWQHTGLQDQRQVVEKQPVNRLADEERQQVIEICNQEEFRSQSPKQIVPTLADRGIYLASESTFYRILRAEDMLHHRRPHSITEALREAQSLCGNRSESGVVLGYHLHGQCRQRHVLLPVPVYGYLQSQDCGLGSV